jgi:hypothetical protein
LAKAKETLKELEYIKTASYALLLIEWNEKYDPIVDLKLEDLKLELEDIEDNI